MYVPKHFAIANESELYDFIDTWSFGTLITTQQGRITANHVPFLVSREENRLYAHLARPNQQWKELETDDEVLVSFAGPHAYISPSWYKTEQLVPTWNFAAVQVRGKVSLMNEPNQLLDLLSRLSAKHEKRFEQPWTVDKLEPALVEKLVKGIVGFWLDITSIEGKAKFSQNRSAADIKSAAQALNESGTEMEKDVANWMLRGI